MEEGQGVFFVVAPFCSCPASLVSRKFFAVGPGCAKCFFFCCAPLGAATFRRGQSKKKTPPREFFFCSGPGEKPRAGTGLLLPLPFPGAGGKKKTPWVVFSFCCGPARMLTHSLRAWVAMPPPRRVVFVFFCCGAGPDRGGVFFLLWPRPDAHSLTVGWGDFGKARVVFFFLLRPRRVFLDNNKKCLGYYIGSKKTRRGHSKKKKNTTSCGRR